jgi:DNA helicase HerA-like ATPase
MTTALFAYNDRDALGVVRAVDTASVIVGVDNLELLKRMQVNRLVVLQSSKAGQFLIGIVQRIVRDAPTAKELELEQETGEDQVAERNTVKVTLIGTFVERDGHKIHLFKRTLESVPEIDAFCFSLEGDLLTRFMRVVSDQSESNAPKLSLGTYSLDQQADAFLNANRFFQRHAAIVGSTGSGKSWTTARLVEQIADLPNANAILFDIHGEYRPLSGRGIQHLRIAGTGDLDSNRALDAGVLYLPYWLLAYEDMMTILADREDSNAPNQAMVMSRAVTTAKRRYLDEHGQTDVLQNFTIDSPVPYDIASVQHEVNEKNTEMVPGANDKNKQGELHGKLSRLIARMDNRIADRKLGFMFRPPAETFEVGWLEMLAKRLMAGTRDQDQQKGGVKIIDFSEVPSDILPVVVGRVVSMIFSVAQWTPSEERHPIALLCDEAHLYIPEKTSTAGLVGSSLQTFHRVAKEGRKYGVGLVIISQRPSEVSRTVLSQCNNFVAMRLTNAEDQSVVQRLLPDNLSSLAGVLPILDTGEALVVGDACSLPARIRISQPLHQPDSRTVNFWDVWSKDQPNEHLASAVQAWRRQSSTGRDTH